MTALTLSGKTYEIPPLKLSHLIAGAALIDRINSASHDAAVLMIATSAALRARAAGEDVAVPVRPFSQTVATTEPMLKLFELATANTDNPLKADDLLADLSLSDVPAIVAAYVDLAVASGLFPAPSDENSGADVDGGTLPDTDAASAA